MRPSPIAVLVTTALTLAGCGGPQSAGEHRAAPRPLDEARALELAAEVLSEYGATAEGRRPVHLTSVDFDLDVAVSGKQVGVEYMTDADRHALAGVVGRRTPGQLRVISVAQQDGQRVEVLFLEDSDYRYDPDPIEHEGGAPTIQEVEGRFRRDLRDFLEHERTAGNL